MVSIMMCMELIWALCFYSILRLVFNLSLHAVWKSGWELQNDANVLRTHLKFGCEAYSAAIVLAF